MQEAEQIDVWRAAFYLIKLYGAEAQMNALIRSERARLDGDLVGYRSWKEISAKVAVVHRQQLSGVELN